jgi:hypothetical protein
MTHHQMNEDQFPESQEELVRLKERAGRYLEYAIDKKKGKREAKITSLAIMISLERVKAVEHWKKHHRTYPQPLTRWMHFKKAVWK